MVREPQAGPATFHVFCRAVHYPSCLRAVHYWYCEHRLVLLVSLLPCTLVVMHAHDPTVSKVRLGLVSSYFAFSHSRAGA